MGIEKNIELFLNGYGNKNKGRQPSERYSSFDYCFNYFQSFREQNKIKGLVNNDNLQASCLHIGFYLASWGMLRGSSFLLEKSAKYYESIIDSIANFDIRIWKIDIDNYTENNIEILLDFKEIIKKQFQPYKASDTLITKIMLGIFANVPAYDQYVKKTYSINTFNKGSLKKLNEFYSREQNKPIIDSYSKTLKTHVFNKGDAPRKYTKAKIVDMNGFIQGIRST